MRTGWLIILLTLVLVIGCDSFLPGKRVHYPSDNPGTYLKSARLNIELAERAREFSKSLTHEHYMIARRNLIVYQATAGIPLSVGGIDFTKLDEEIIPAARLEALVSSQNDIFESAIYPHSKIYISSVLANKDMLLDVADALTEQGQPDRAEKFRNHYISWVRGSGDTVSEAKNCFRLLKTNATPKDPQKADKNLEKAVSLLQKADRRYITAEDYIIPAIFHIRSQNPQKAKDIFNEIYNERRYQTDIFYEISNPLDTVFSKLDSKSDFDTAVKSIDLMDDTSASYMILEALVNNLSKSDSEFPLDMFIDDICAIAKKNARNDNHALLVLQLAEKYYKSGQADIAFKLIDFVFDAKQSKRHVNVFYDSPIEITRILMNVDQKDRAISLIDKRFNKRKNSFNIHNPLLKDTLDLAICFVIAKEDEKAESCMDYVFQRAEQVNVDRNSLYPFHIKYAYYLSTLGRNEEVEKTLEDVLIMIKEFKPDMQSMSSDRREVQKYLKKLVEFDMASKIASNLDNRASTSDMFSIAVAIGYWENQDYDKVLKIAESVAAGPFQTELVTKCVDKLIENGEYDKAIKIADLFPASYQSKTRESIIEKSALAKAFMGDFDVLNDPLYSDEELIENPLRLPNAALSYLKSNPVSGSEMKEITGNVYRKIRRVEYLQSLHGSKDFELAQKAEQNLPDFITYILLPESAESLIRQGYVPLDIPLNQQQKAEDLFKKGEYEKAWEVIKKANEEDWSPAFEIGCRFGIGPDYWFDEFPVKFARKDRFDLAFKTIQYINPTVMGDVLKEINTMMIESDYKMTDDDLYYLRKLIHTDKFLWKHPYIEK